MRSDLSSPARVSAPVAARTAQAAAAGGPSSWSWIGIPVPAVLAAAPDFALGGVYLATWLDPRAFSPDLATFLLQAMILEFIIIHSSAIMGAVMVASGPQHNRRAVLLGLGAFYTVIVGAFSLAFLTVWPLVAFWMLTGNRLLGVLLGQAPAVEASGFVQRSWAATCLIYMVFVFLTMIASVPQLGLTPEVVSGLHIPGHGIWVDQPWRVMAFGFLYFTTVGLSELFGHGWAKVQA